MDLVADQPYLVRLGAQLPGTPPRIVAPGPGGQAPTLGTSRSCSGRPSQPSAPQLGDVPGLLARDAAVNVVRRTYALAADDTLFTALDVLALDLSAPAAAGRRRRRSGRSERGRCPTSSPPGPCSTSPAPVLVGEPDTLRGIAAAHGLTPAELGRSVAGRTDVLRPGCRWSCRTARASPRVPRSSLEGLAARAAAPLDDVVNAVAGVSGLLVPGTVWALPGPANPRAGTPSPRGRRGVDRGGRRGRPAGRATAARDAGLAGHRPSCTSRASSRAGAVLAYLSRVPGFTLSGG